MSKKDKENKIPRASDARKMQSEESARQQKMPNHQEVLRLHTERSQRLYLLKYAHIASKTKNRCFVRAVLHPKFDAYYCPKCLIWLEDRCDKSKNCEICKSRTSVKKALENK